MRPTKPSLLLFGSLVCCGSTEFDFEADANRGPPPALACRIAPPCALASVKIYNFKRLVYQGPIDLEQEARRIGRGEKLRFAHDGGEFENREHRLPLAPRGYYHEYVHPTAGIRGAGPQRLVRGNGGELDYTPDHYQSFVELPEACAALAQLH